VPMVLVRVACLLCLTGSAFPIWPEITRTACPVKGQVRVPSDELASSDFVELHRGSCYGSCPGYTVRISADGSVAWLGQGSVHQQGRASAQIAAANAKALVEQFRSVEFWSLCEGYSQGITDLPTYETVVYIGGNAKRVSDYADSAPDFLRKLDLQLDTLADTHRWRHGDPAMEVFEAGMREECYLPKPGVTPLMCAASQAGGMLPGLLRPADINARDSSGWTPLMYAAYSGDDQVLAQLLAVGAEPKAVSTMRQTVMMAAVSGYPWSAAKMSRLKAAGCDINATDSTGATALMLAMRQFWQPERIEWLMANGALSSLKDAHAKTAITLLNETYTKMGGKASGEEASYRKVLQLLQHAGH
jgi:uncharacterized protein DUF6438/ankyrin repeat protein